MRKQPLPIGLPMGHSPDVVCRAEAALRAAGEDGLTDAELKEAAGSPESDNACGYLLHDMRRCGILVQREEGFNFIAAEAQCKIGAWMRHPELGVVRVLYERVGFPIVKVKVLEGDELRVPRTQLSGR